MSDWSLTIEFKQNKDATRCTEKNELHKSGHPVCNNRNGEEDMHKEGGESSREASQDCGIIGSVR
ncbi:hypothetical protein TSUD_279270 [Trifolium subterraneum]|uniref:Uncharacterized protein n=1 Tax=Trifolium subterraneum TaxID=3900 RepID=A0A2Z6N1Q4_TRISU|nr:hypothetical protein TSUD_279270 [Trifolium subterraneum]